MSETTRHPFVLTTGVTHATTRRRSASSDESNDRLGVLARLVVLLKVFCRVLFHGATDLTNENQALALRVVKQKLDKVKRCAARVRVLQTKTMTDGRVSETK